MTSNEDKNREAIHTLVGEELVWVSQQKGNELDNLRYRAFVLLMRDLLDVSWRVFYFSFR